MGLMRKNLGSVLPVVWQQRVFLCLKFLMNLGEFDQLSL